MVQRVHMVLEDDLDGSEAAETVHFALDGVSYEIDLSDKHAGELREVLAEWVARARRTGGRKTQAKKIKAGSANDIRAWALANGIQVSSRGRVAAEVVQAYEQAMLEKN